MQDQRDVVEARRIDAAGRRHAAQAHDAGGVHFDGEDGHFVAGGLARVLGAFARKQQDLGVGVLEIEAELFLSICGIERRRGTGDTRGEKRHDCRQAIR